MDAVMEPHYVKLVHRLGGEVNHSKTITSDRCAEFAGRVILPERVCLKTYKFKDPSDVNFMSYMSDLGPQASSMLRPKQLKVWNEFKYVPGVAFDGPWSTDSFGLPLVDRVSWSLTKTTLFDETPDSDPIQKDVEQSLLQESLRRESLSG